MSKYYDPENETFKAFPPESYTLQIGQNVVDNKRILPEEAIFIDVKSKMINPKEYLTEGKYMSELAAKRGLVALRVPQVMPPISTEELRGLTRLTEAETQLRELDEIAGYRPAPAKFVAVVEADASFDVAINDEWGLNNDAGRDTVVNIGTTALFNVATYSMQANVLQNRIDELASGRPPVEQ
ncbi:MAG TPA: hypothetical protein PKD20_01870 [Candidatus Saccharibacteria bacterium]|jgi:hypothetical protein|nr:hypothetical protein [Candidatus Saccharibacteria bacterium]HMT55606.1 hypothetical protein [Candidatus Saccharibacteria bacterium]